MAESAPLILIAEIKSLRAVDQGVPGAQPGMALSYVTAIPREALRGITPGTALVEYLAYVPLDARGRLPNLRKQAVVLFARPVPGAITGEIARVQLMTPGAQWLWSAELDKRLRGVLSDLGTPGAPATVTGVSEAIYQPGTLAGEGETQLFLSTAGGAPASITVRHRPGAAPAWSVSFSEVVDMDGKPPAKDTLAWYRLACSLPERLPDAAQVSPDGDARLQAMRDYLLVRADLGPCGRTDASRP
ncbi:hypothetical protein [Novosphingobium ovatum]|nr:hypothetical protein [Novosphingobium ovatum]